MSKKFFQTKSKSLAYALNYIGYRFYKFNDDGITTYSFLIDEKFLEKINKLNDIKFS